MSDDKKHLAEEETSMLTMDNEKKKSLEENLNQSEGPTEKKMRQTAWRWLMLVLCCFVLTGGYYCLDIPSPIKSHVVEVG